jgi:hypothetical protein
MKKAKIVWLKNASLKTTPDLDQVTLDTRSGLIDPQQIKHNQNQFQNTITDFL